MRIIKGNLLDINCGIIMHQCNCQGAYGAGIAKQIAERWPDAKTAYYKHLKDCKTHNVNPLGTVNCVAVSDKLYVANLLSQDHYGNAARTRICYTDYAALNNALQQLTAAYPDTPLYAPWHMACGLAGGDWSRVSQILEHYNVIVVKL